MADSIQYHPSTPMEALPMASLAQPDPIPDSLSSSPPLPTNTTTPASTPMPTSTATATASITNTHPKTITKSYSHLKQTFLTHATHLHRRTPYLSTLPLPVILITLFLLLINILTWLLTLLILIPTHNTSLLSTSALSYTLGLRHALDADHISAIDLMTRRLIATGQRPVTVGTFFSLGHSTIVIVTSIVVAATAAGVSKKFEGFSSVGGIIGSSVSAGFLMLLGGLNAYILWRLVVQLRKVVRLDEQELAQGKGWEVDGGGAGGGVMFRILKGVFRLVDRPWKMYPVGVVFGLGFDTSSEIALLGISSIQASRGTSIWLILVFPVLFTAGMCLVDTVDGALMMGLYVAPMGLGGGEKDGGVGEMSTGAGEEERSRREERVKDPLVFLYYSVVLTSLTVVVAVTIGTIQLLTMVLNVANPKGKFWDGVQTAGDHYEVIGGGICGSFVVVGGISVLCYKPWRRWIERRRERYRMGRGGRRAEERVSLTLEQSHEQVGEAEITTVAVKDKGNSESGMD